MPSRNRLSFAAAGGLIVLLWAYPLQAQNPPSVQSGVAQQEGKQTGNAERGPDEGKRQAKGHPGQTAPFPVEPPIPLISDWAEPLYSDPPAAREHQRAEEDLDAQKGMAK